MAFRKAIKFLSRSFSSATSFISSNFLERYSTRFLRSAFSSRKDANGMSLLTRDGKAEEADFKTGEANSDAPILKGLACFWIIDAMMIRQETDMRTFNNILLFRLATSTEVIFQAAALS